MPEQINIKNDSNEINDAVAESIGAMSHDHVAMTVKALTHVVVKGWMESMNDDNMQGLRAWPNGLALRMLTMTVMATGQPAGLTTHVDACHSDV